MSIDAKLPAQPYPLTQSPPGDLRIPPLLVSVPWYNSFLLMARAVAALGPAAFASTVTGWGTSAGGVRGTVNGGFTQVAAGAYSQPDTQAVNNQVAVLSKRLAQLISDLETSKVLGT